MDEAPSMDTENPITNAGCSDVGIAFGGGTVHRDVEVGHVPGIPDLEFFPRGCISCRRLRRSPSHW